MFESSNGIEEFKMTNRTTPDDQTSAILALYGMPDTISGDT